MRPDYVALETCRPLISPGVRGGAGWDRLALVRSGLAMTRRRTPGAHPQRARMVGAKEGGPSEFVLVSRSSARRTAEPLGGLPARLGRRMQ